MLGVKHRFRFTDLSPSSSAVESRFFETVIFFAFTLVLTVSEKRLVTNQVGIIILNLDHEYATK